MEFPGAPAVPATTPTPYSVVADTRAFDGMMESLLPASRLAIDIEADSLYHYFDKVCLIQVSTDRETFILDPLSVKDLRPLAPLMSSAEVEKVFHAAGYDVFCLKRDYGFNFVNLFDTHLAALLTGYEYLGLSAMMEALLGVSHSKRRQRDDWSRRPLDSEQLEYAAMDTHHLLRLRDLLEKELIEKNRHSWALEEFAASAVGLQRQKEFDPEGFRQIKGSRELSLQELAVLRALYLLRERYARELDVPPFKVLNNPILLDLARRPPLTPRDLFRRPGISFRVARKFGNEIFRTIEKARTEDTGHLVMPVRKEWKPPSKEARIRLDRLRRWRQSKAVELQLHVGVIFPGGLLESLAVCPPPDLAALASLDGMRRWRVREFGAEVLTILHAPNPHS